MRSIFAASLVALAAGAARAQCDWTLSYVPDFDQRRGPAPGIPGLPGNGGMYCVPTSITNWFAYFANRGLPQPLALSGPRVWWSDSNYNRVTSTLSIMGSLMGTSATGGTSGGGGQAGAWTYQLAYAQNRVVISQFWCGGPGGCPTPAKFTAARMLGGYVAACFGFYNADQPGLYTRSGGHCITINGADSCNSGFERIRYRDPASDGLNSTQSGFVTHVVEVTPTFGLYRGRATSPYVPQTRHRLAGSGNNMLDGWYVLMPVFAMSTSSFDAAGIQILRPFQFDGSDLPAVQNIATAPGALGAVAMHPRFQDFHYIARPLAAGGEHRLFHLNPLTGQSTKILGSIAGIEHLAYSRQGELFTCDGATLKKFDVDGPAAEPTGSVALPAVPLAIAYDDRNDALAVLLPTGVPNRHNLVRLSRALGTPISSVFLPDTPALPGDVDMAFAPDGTLAVSASGLPTIFRYSSNGSAWAGSIPLPAGTQPRGLNFADNGNILFTDGGVARELKPGPSGWVDDPTSLFAGQNVGEFFAIARSRTNHDPAEHEGPEFANLEDPMVPGGIPDCYANCDGSTIPPVLNVNDFQCFLNLFSSGRIEANCDGSTIPPVLNVNDFACFQTKFAAGCP